MAVPIIFTLLQATAPESSVGSATGVLNGIGNGFGIAGPLIIGFIVSITGSYNIALLAMGILALVGGIVFQLQYRGR